MDSTVIELKSRGRGRAVCASAAPVVPLAAAFDALPAPALVLAADGRIGARNAAARALLGPEADPGVRCCTVFGCRTLATGCVARGGTGAVPATVSLPGGRRATLTAAPVGPGGDRVVLLAVEAADPGDGPAPVRLWLLGRSRVEGPGQEGGGDWVAHRPGQVLKYLALARGRVVSVDELLDALWPGAGRSGATNVRQAIHALRDRLEPGRERGARSAVVRSVRGGYVLAPGVALDVDRFEAHARAGLDALRAGAEGAARRELAAAAALYEGDLLADEPYADWALAERERLRDLVGQVLGALAGLEEGDGDLDAAAHHLQRLSALDPLDLDGQRRVIALLLRRGRRSEALRRWELVRRRYRRAFGEDPASDLGITIAA